MALGPLKRVVRYVALVTSVAMVTCTQQAEHGLRQGHHRGHQCWMDFVGQRACLVLNQSGKVVHDDVSRCANPNHCTHGPRQCSSPSGEYNAYFCDGHDLMLHWHACLVKETAHSADPPRILRQRPCCQGRHTDQAVQVPCDLGPLTLTCHDDRKVEAWFCPPPETQVQPQNHPDGILRQACRIEDDTTGEEVSRRQCAAAVTCTTGPLTLTHRGRHLRAFFCDAKHSCPQQELLSQEPLTCPSLPGSSSHRGKKQFPPHWPQDGKKKSAGN